MSCCLLFVDGIGSMYVWEVEGVIFFVVIFILGCFEVYSKGGYN